MPSVVVNMVTNTEDLVAEKRNAKIKPSLIMVDNVDAGDDSQLTFQDVFDVNASVVAATGAAAVAVAGQIANRLRINVSMDACVSLRDELKDVEFLGKAQVERSVAGVETEDEDCRITLGYDFQ